MLRVAASLFVVFALAQSAFAASQTITCENKKQRLTIRAKLNNLDEDLSAADVQVAVLHKKDRGFQGALKNEKLAPTTSVGNVAISGEAEAKNLTFELIVPQNKLKRGFKNLNLSAFLDNPLSDNGHYPNRVSVRCSSQVN